MPDIVLAIDDNPERYQDLQNLLFNEDGILLIALNNPQGVEMLLSTGCVMCVLLDHDMPTVENGALTLQYDGVWFARNVLGPRPLPVCVTSANTVGSRNISDVLDEYAVPHIQIPIANPRHTEEWRKFVLLDRKE